MFSCQMFFELLLYILSLIWSTSDVFGTTILISSCSIILAHLLYLGWAHSRLGSTRDRQGAGRLMFNRHLYICNPTPRSGTRGVKRVEIKYFKKYRVHTSEWSSRPKEFDDHIILVILHQVLPLSKMDLTRITKSWKILSKMIP